MTTIGKPYWHIHHEKLVEFTTEPIKARIAYIKKDKPAHEVDVRLRWLTPVVGRLPAAFDKARAEYDKARAAFDKAWAEYNKAWAECDKAEAKAQPSLERLHAKEHKGCPWDGRTLFP